ncbi:CAP domain-containing protein [Bailinhaonella thermotolerans]|uniref:CAP domain-containing protein n=1 Tax=Bailinhaonella thermotolerans TaxID=1070861 RepID=UPI00192A3DD1|nr:CAP domain-containing protein [Bailinhaonella thermotolerans]
MSACAAVAVGATAVGVMALVGEPGGGTAGALRSARGQAPQQTGTPYTAQSEDRVPATTLSPEGAGSPGSASRPPAAPAPRSGPPSSRPAPSGRPSPPKPKPPSARPTPEPPEPEPTRRPRPPKPAPPERDEPPSARSGGLEDAVVRLTNEAREDAGCAPLRVDERLARAARAHSADMAEHDYFSHTSKDGRSPWDRIRAEGYDQPGAENIARGYGGPQAVMKGWLKSPGHRANILNCKLKAIGVGVQEGAGGPWWTQDFGWR